MKCLLRLLTSSSWRTEHLSIGMLGRIAIRVADKANASSPLQLVDCTDHQTVVRYAATPADGCPCDVELHEARGARGKDCNRIPILRDCFGVAVIQT